MSVPSGMLASGAVSPIPITDLYQRRRMARAMVEILDCSWDSIGSGSAMLGNRDIAMRGRTIAWAATAAFLDDEVLSHTAPYMRPIWVAISIAGVAALNLTYARFSPCGVIIVFTESTLALNSCSTACLISCRSAFLFTTKISLFSDSISRMDFSVASGFLMMVYGSII